MMNVSGEQIADGISSSLPLVVAEKGLTKALENSEFDTLMK